MAKRKEAFGAYWFKVDLDFQKMGLGTPSFRFRSCTGLKSESAVVDLDEGGFNITTRKLIGKTKFPNIVLKHGFHHAESVLWKARQKFQLDIPLATAKLTADLNRGRVLPNRFSGKITIMGPNGAEASFGFANGFICKWEGPDLDASKNEIAIESVEIAHEGLFIVPGPNDTGGARSAPPPAEEPESEEETESSDPNSSPSSDSSSSSDDTSSAV